MYEAIKTGQVPALRLGRRVLIARATLCRLAGNGAPTPVTADEDGQAPVNGSTDELWGLLVGRFPGSRRAAPWFLRR